MKSETYRNVNVKGKIMQVLLDGKPGAETCPQWGDMAQFEVLTFWWFFFFGGLSHLFPIFSIWSVRTSWWKTWTSGAMEVSGGRDDLTPLFFRVRLAYSMQCYASMHQTSEDSFIADRDVRLVVSFDFQVVKSLCPEIRSRQVMARWFWMTATFTSALTCRSLRQGYPSKILKARLATSLELKFHCFLVTMHNFMQFLKSSFLVCCMLGHDGHPRIHLPSRTVGNVSRSPPISRKTAPPRCRMYLIVFMFPFGRHSWWCLNRCNDVSTRTFQISELYRSTHRMVNSQPKPEFLVQMMQNGEHQVLQNWHHQTAFDLSRLSRRLLWVRCVHWTFNVERMPMLRSWITVSLVISEYRLGQH